MITFVVPTPYLASNTTFTVDRLPTLAHKVRTLESEVEYGVLKDFRADGVNAVVKNLQFNLANLPAATAGGIIDYFKSLKGSSTIAITEDAVVYNYRIVSWRVNVDSQKFISISVSCEEYFNAN